MNPTLTVSLFELIGTAGIGALVMALVMLARDVARTLPREEKPRKKVPTPAVEMVVLKPWSERDQVTEEPIAPASRWARETEPTPLCPALPQADSLAWKFKPFRPEGLGSAIPTGAYPIVELDVEPEPVQLPGFEVRPDARKRFVRSDAELAAAAQALGLEPKKPKRKPTAKVDLDNNRVVVTA